MGIWREPKYHTVAWCGVVAGIGLGIVALCAGPLFAGAALGVMMTLVSTVLALGAIIEG